MLHHIAGNRVTIVQMYNVKPYLHVSAGGNFM